MNQSAVRFLCSCVVLAVVAAQAQAGSALPSPALQATRELEQSIRQRENDAHKVVQKDAIKHVMSKTVLLAQLQGSLNPQPVLAMAIPPFAHTLTIEPSAD